MQRNLAFWSILSLKLYDGDIVKRGDFLWNPTNIKGENNSCWELLDSALSFVSVYTFIYSHQAESASRWHLRILHCSCKIQVWLYTIFMIRTKIKTAYKNIKKTEIYRGSWSLHNISHDLDNQQIITTIIGYVNTISVL